jgi:cell division protein FtsW
MVSHQRQSLDLWLIFASLALLALGLLMVTSASPPLATDKLGQPLYFLIHQGANVSAGLALAIFTFYVPSTVWARHAPLLLLIAMGLLLLVLIPGIGKEVNGSVRWIPLGPVNMQVSEPAKLFALIYVASYLQRHSAVLQDSLTAVLFPLFVLAVLAILLLLEPDYGTAVVLLTTGLGMLFLAGVNIQRFIAIQTVVITVMAVLLYTSEYRWLRLIGFLEPWADPFNSGYQLTQSLIAIGRGELWGVGLGTSVQKLFYLPEAYTDFIFAILAEELGLAGVVSVIWLYAIIVWRAFDIAARAEWLEMTFIANLAYGIGLWFGVQALLNMGVTMGVLPTKGLTLPLVSYGGSSVVVMCMALAILLRSDMETRRADPRLRPRIPTGLPRVKEIRQTEQKDES